MDISRKKKNVSPIDLALICVCVCVPQSTLLHFQRAAALVTQ